MSLAPFTPTRSFAECHNLLTAEGRLLEMETALVEGKYMKRVWKNLWPNMRTFWLETAKKWSSRDYLVFEDGSQWTYYQMMRWTVEIAKLLHHKFHVGLGDRGI